MARKRLSKLSPAPKYGPGNTPTQGGKVTYAKDGFAMQSPQQQSYGTQWSQGWFGPGVPFPPVAPPEVAGRLFDYPYGVNLQLRPRAFEALGFLELRNLADNYDLLRLVIETRKDQVEAMDWDIQAKEDMEDSVSEADIKKVRDFFKRPDKENLWAGWLRKFLEDLFVIDAIAIYPRFDNKGDLWGLELIDAGTITRLLDESGRTPMFPDPAYQQIIKGLPAVDYTVWSGQKDTFELIYFMRNPRSNRIYGFSPVEQVVMTVNIALRRQLSQLNYFTEGNIPEALAGVPENWSMDQIKQFQVWFDSMQMGDDARMRKLKFLPMDPSKIKMTREGDATLKDMFDEWLARIVCFAFSISPTQLVKETNRATASTVQDQARLEGLMPMLTWLKNIFDFIIQEILGMENIEFVWDTEESIDALTRAKCDQIYWTCGALTADEIRKERFNKDPLTDDEKASFPAAQNALMAQQQMDMAQDNQEHQHEIDHKQVENDQNRPMFPGGPLAGAGSGKGAPAPKPGSGGSGAGAKGNSESKAESKRNSDTEKIEDIVREALAKVLSMDHSARAESANPGLGQPINVTVTPPAVHLTMSQPGAPVVKLEPVFNVSAPNINITQPDINITMPDIQSGDVNITMPEDMMKFEANLLLPEMLPAVVNFTPQIEVQPAQVNVEAPIIKVEQPSITVQPAAITVQPAEVVVREIEKVATRQIIKRDNNQEIVSIDTVPLEKD